jgi:hypothetical protein
LPSGTTDWRRDQRRGKRRTADRQPEHGCRQRGTSLTSKAPSWTSQSFWSAWRCSSPYLGLACADLEPYHRI